MAQISDLAALIASGHRAVREGRLPEARRIFDAALRQSPGHGEALYTCGFVALQQRDLTSARRYLEQAAIARPRDPVTQMTLAVVLREAGDSASELRALQTALAIDPYFAPGLLSLGAWQERNGFARQAAMTYANVLKILPDERGWPPELKAHLAHARSVRDRNTEQLFAHLKNAVAVGEDDGRVDEMLAILAGRTRPYWPEPAALLVPRLPPIPFYDRQDFPFLAGLEGETGPIRQELLDGLRDMEGFAPYVQYAPGVPVNQWAELNHSDKWSSLFLWKDGKPVDENQRRFPKTAAALARLPMADIAGFCPTAMFSALKPGARIPPHIGETNARLVVHLPLVIPANCSYRVGYEWRKWVEGECLIFDNSINHEARNNSNAMRIVLIFDIWNPYLTTAERSLVGSALAATRDYYASS